MLGFICSLTVFMMIAAIIRIVTDALGKRPDYSWLLVWNSVEMTLGTTPIPPTISTYLLLRLRVTNRILKLAQQYLWPA